MYVVYFELIRAEKKESMDKQTCRDSRDWEEYILKGTLNYYLSLTVINILVI